MALQADGKIILGGETSRNSDAVLIRCNKNGILDSSFGRNGYAIRKTTSFQSINAICLQPDNKILAAGRTFTDRSTDDDFLLLRYTAKGLPDSTFGINGEAYPVDFNKLWDRAYAITLQPDNKIVLAVRLQLNMFIILRGCNLVLFASIMIYRSKIIYLFFRYA